MKSRRRWIAFSVALLAGSAFDPSRISGMGLMLYGNGRAFALGLPRQLQHGPLASSSLCSVV